MSELHRKERFFLGNDHLISIKNLTDLRLFLTIIEVINVKTYVGLLDKIRVIKTQPLLVRFTLETIHQPLNCIVANVEIADKLMMMEERKYNIAVTGHLNRRNQLVVESLQVRNPDQYTRNLKI